jgi:hypothetical protein
VTPRLLLPLVPMDDWFDAYSPDGSLASVGHLRPGRTTVYILVSLTLIRAH